MIEKVNEWDRQISISIGVLTVLAALVGFLQVRAGNLNNQFRADASRYAVEAMRVRSTGEARSSFEAGHMLRLSELVEQQKALANGREDAASAAKLDAIEQALKALSPVLREPYAALGDAAVAKYESDTYVVDAVHAEQMRAVTASLDQAWDYKANTYVVHLTLIAVVLALLGLSQAMENLPRLMVLVVSAVMTAVTLGWVISTYVLPVPVLSTAAIDAYAKAYGAAYQGKYDEALKGYDEALTALPTYADAHYERGMTLLALGRSEDGLQALQAARANDYDATSVDAMVSYMQLTVGKLSESEATAQGWAAREPENRDALGALLAAQAARENVDAARTTAQKLQESAAAAIKKQADAGAGADDTTIGELDNAASTLRDVVLSSLGEEESIKGVKLSDASRGALQEIERALRSQAMRAAFGLTGESKGKASDVVVGMLDGEAFAPAEKIDSAATAIALQVNAAGVPANAHVLVRFYQDGIENEALRYVTTWTVASDGAVVLPVPIDIGEAYVLAAGNYEVELYIDGVQQGERAAFVVAE